MDELRRLQDWYQAECNGDWEHTYGISLETIDNPGWRLSIDIVETALKDKPFADVTFQGEAEDDWYRCRTTAAAFEGVCGPAHLSTIIEIFNNWAKS